MACRSDLIPVLLSSEGTSGAGPGLKRVEMDCKSWDELERLQYVPEAVAESESFGRLCPEAAKGGVVEVACDMVQGSNLISDSERLLQYT